MSGAATVRASTAVAVAGLMTAGSILASLSEATPFIAGVFAAAVAIAAATALASPEVTRAKARIVLAATAASAALPCAVLITLGVIGPAVVAATVAPLAALALALRERDDDALGRRAGLALVGLALADALAARHAIVSSSGLAPDDLVVLAVAVACALRSAFVPTIGARGWSAALTAALLAYGIVGSTLIVARGYGSDAVVAAHRAADILLAGGRPYADFDMLDALARRGLGPELATDLRDGTPLRTLDYPALSFLLPAPLVALGLTDLRWLYLAEIVVIALAAQATAPLAARPYTLAALVGSGTLLLQYVGAGVDPSWALLALGAWLARGRRWPFALALGLALASRQTAWPVGLSLLFWLWPRLGAREAITRAATALGVAVAVHLPFLVSTPAAVVRGITDPILQPLEQHGVGPSALAAGATGELVPLAFNAAAAVAFVLVLVASRARRASAPGAALALPVLPLYLAWRSLQSYLAFVPVHLALGDGGAPQRR